MSVLNHVSSDPALFKKEKNYEERCKIIGKNKKDYEKKKLLPFFGLHENAVSRNVDLGSAKFFIL